MAVRNFYIDAEIDGRRTDLGGGPASKEGGMTVHITQRNDGSIETAYKISCWVDRDGMLVTRVCDKTGKTISENKTER